MVRLGLLIFCRKIIFTDRKVLREKGPLLLACNHPNSFFDALLLGAFFKQPVHFLARGDAFKNPIAAKILTALKAIPIYRLKEGKEYLALNDNTFERCLQILQHGGIVLIFSEGLCLNQWQLRPLKKGTARIAINAFKQPSIKEAFKILPVSFNYSSFTRFTKNVIINFSEPILHQHLPTAKSDAEQIGELNKMLYAKLEGGMLVEKSNPGVVQFLLNNKAVSKEPPVKVIPFLKQLQSKVYTNRLETICTKLKGSKKVCLSRTVFFKHLLWSLLLLTPALIGLLVHLPFYLPLKKMVRNKTTGTVFYHSVLFGALIIVYPLYVLVLFVLLAIVFESTIFLSIMLLMPLLALIFLQWKDYGEGIFNYLKLSDKERKSLREIV